MKEKIIIHVDDKKIILNENHISGMEIKHAAGISGDISLVEEIRDEADREIINGEIYDIKNGMKFFSGLYHKEVKIFIDNKEYVIEKSNLSGAELKAIANISLEEYKLVKEVKNGPDMEIENNVIYNIENKDEFFSVPAGIQNGGGNNGTIA